MLKSLIGFHSANKIDNYSRGGRKRKNEKNPKESTEQVKTIINVFLESLLSESFPLLGVMSTSLPQEALQHCAYLWTCCGGSSDSNLVQLMCSCLQCLQLSELVHFLLWELSMTFYIFHRHRVFLVDCVDLIFILYSWWEGFGSSSLATLPLGLNYGFISTSACGSSTGVCF